MPVRLFLRVLQLAIAITPVLAALLLLAPGPGRRYSARLRCGVWLAVSLRLLLPLNVSAPSAPLRLDLVGGSAGSTGGESLLPEGLTGAAGELAGLPEAALEPLVGGAVTVDPATVNHPPRRAASSPVQWLAGLWLAGAAGYGLYLLTAHLWAVRRLRRWSLPERDPAVLALLEDIRREQDIRRTVCLFRCNRVGSPMLVGLWRPRVLLPGACCEEPGALRMVLSHELCHLRRRDLWRKLALLLAGVVYWFHPLVHLLRRQAGLDIEMACDEGVLRDADRALRRAYGFAVLSVLESQGRNTAPLSTRFHGGRKQMLRRFGQMVDLTPKRRGALPLALVLLAVLGCGALVGCTMPEAETAAQAAAPGPAQSGGEGEVPPENGTLSPAEPAEGLRGLDESETAASGQGMTYPLPGFYTISNPFVPPSGNNDLHPGIDITGEEVYGADVVAALPGEVQYVELDYLPGQRYGIYLVLDHGGGVSTLYAQLSEVSVEQGERVEQGQLIGKVGSTGNSTGPHLHFEVRVDGEAVDPWEYLFVEEGDPAPDPTQVGFVLPLDGSDPFTMDHISDGGVWFAMERGGRVRASAAGTVLQVWPGGEGAGGSVLIDDGNGYIQYGNGQGTGGSVLIDHGNGYTTRYDNLAEVSVEVGDVLEMAQSFAQPAQTGAGPYFYFAIHYNGRLMEATDYIGTLD